MQFTARRFEHHGLREIENLPQLQRFDADERFAMRVVATVLPFRVNTYVLDELIDWNAVPDDPIFQLTFPQRGMLRADHFEEMAAAIRGGEAATIKDATWRIRQALDPHPAGQLTANVPSLDDEPVAGLQHKYRETCLLFPASGQTCHSYCTYCFRWPQFVGYSDLRFATDESRRFVEYLRLHTEITDVLVTGGDPMIMSTRKLATYIEPLLAPEMEHVQTIRIGTKALAYWPHRFVTDKDADDVLRLLDRVVASGKHLAIMAHSTHPAELSTDITREAIRRIRATGAVIRTQSPLVAHVNDDADVWARMWQEQVRLGCVPYYMFVERQTGAHTYFSVPLVRAHTIFADAFRRLSGLARTVRGPSMSAHPGKVVVDGVAEVGGEKVFVLRFLQARNPDWCLQPFFARFDPAATWLDQLRPAWGESFFFEQDAMPREFIAVRAHDGVGGKSLVEGAGAASPV